MNIVQLYLQKIAKIFEISSNRTLSNAFYAYSETTKRYVIFYLFKKARTTFTSLKSAGKQNNIDLKSPSWID